MRVLGNIADFFKEEYDSALENVSPSNYGKDTTHRSYVSLMANVKIGELLGLDPSNIYQSGWVEINPAHHDEVYNWHVDGGGYVQTALLVAGPNPTQFVESEKLFDPFAFDFDYQLQKAIEDGQARIVEPNYGDVVLFRDEIHRSNPKSKGQRRLVLRFYGPEISKKYESSTNYRLV